MSPTDSCLCNTLSSIGEHLGGKDLLNKVCHWCWDLRIQRLNPFLVYSLCFCLRFKMWVFSLLPQSLCLLPCLLWFQVPSFLLGCPDASGTSAWGGLGEVQNRWGLKSASSIQIVRQCYMPGQEGWKGVQDECCGSALSPFFPLRASRHCCKLGWRDESQSEWEGFWSGWEQGLDR